jgi:anthranilate synthase component 2
MPLVIKTYFDKKPILGVCLGHQAIGEAFGAELGNLTQVFHGVSSTISSHIEDDLLFKDLPPTFEVGRYHSWVVKKETLPDQLIVLSLDDKGEIMAMKHAHYPVYGVQFHPESIMTPHGKKMLENFLNLI